MSGKWLEFSHARFQLLQNTPITTRDTLTMSPILAITTFQTQAVTHCYKEFK